MQKTKRFFSTFQGRTELESLLSKIKSSNIDLEEQLRVRSKLAIFLLLTSCPNFGRSLFAIFLLLKMGSFMIIFFFIFFQTESFDKNQLAREAEEAKGLWESEVRSRSKLGAKVLSCQQHVCTIQT